MLFCFAALLVFGAISCDFLRAQSIPEFVTVGSPNNLPDTNGWPTEFGTVPYSYKIGKYETKVSEYVAFLNAAAKSSDPYGLYGSEVGFFIDRSAGPPFMYSAKTEASNKPVGGVSWLAAARYANWLHNGATNGSSTESGAYDLNGATNGVFLKNTGARYWIPSEAEWYKAAYYDPTLNGGLGGYWKYPTRSNSITTNQANYNLTLASLSSIRDVGSYGVPSYFGTFDQAGNLEETVSEDSLVYYDNFWVGNRGGSFNSSGTNALSSFQRGVWVGLNYENFSSMMFGFRLAAAVTTNVSAITNSLEFVRVDQTNAAAHSSGYGFVGYPYEISKYEITIEQYAAFLNGVAKSDPYGLFDTNMESFTGIRGIQRQGTSGNYRYVLRGTANRPMTYINWFRAARFANWLHNGATSNASTETGAYPLSGNTSSIVAAATNAQYRIPTENEWFKAAYYDPTNNRYWTYPTRSDTPPSNYLWGAEPVATYSNHGSYTLGNNPAASDNKLTGVGQARSPSAYGTYDQGGNVCEWVDNPAQLPYGTMRGGSWGRGSSAMHMTNRDVREAWQSWSDYGFRLVKPASTNSPTNSNPPTNTNNPTPTNPPTSGSPMITSFSPMEVAIGQEIDIFGSGFGTPSNTTLRNLIFSGGDGPDGQPSFWTDSQVRVKVPASATTGLFTILYENSLGTTSALASPSSLRILIFSGYDAWKQSAGFSNDHDCPANDGLTMLDRYFHGITSNVTKSTNRPFSFSTTNLLIYTGQARPVLRFSRWKQATEVDFWIERTTNLASAGWQTAGADVQITTNSANSDLEELTVTDFSQPTGSKVFYRLGLSTNTNLPSTSISNSLSINARNDSISFPKIFQPWEVSTVLSEGRSNSVRIIGTNAEGQKYFTPRHNLRWEVIWRNPDRGESFLSGPSEVTRFELSQKTKEAKKLNPNAIRLAVIEYYEGATNNLSFGPPAISPFWLVSSSGSRLRNFDYDGKGTNFSCLLDFSNPDFQNQIADRAASLVSDGLFDGIFLDCWSENRDGESQWSWLAGNNLNFGNGSPQPWGLTNNNPTGGTLAEVERNARLQLLQKVRNRIGTNKIIIANINYGLAGEHALSAGNPLLSATNLDGVYMECAMLEGGVTDEFIIRDSSNNPIGYSENLSSSPYLDYKNGESENYWRKLEKTMAWVEAPGNLRSQGLNCFEVWHRFSKFDPRDLRWMRAGLSLTLVCSDSYYLFSEPNWWRLDPGIGVKRHAWYDEWNKSLGRPVDAKRSPVNNSQKNSNGTYSRAFDQGVVFYNPFGNSQQALVFTKLVKSVASGLVSTSHMVGPGPDGDIFLLTQPGDPR